MTDNTHEATQTVEEWEKEFDELFWLHRVPRNTKQAQDIKDFIRKTLTQERTRLKEEIEKEIRTVEYGTDELEQQYEDRGFNDGIRKALALLAKTNN